MLDVVLRLVKSLGAQASLDCVSGGSDVQNAQGRIVERREFRLRFAEIGRHNYLVNEPSPAVQETSQVLDKVFRLLSQEGISLNQMAVMLSIYPEELSRLLFSLSVHLYLYHSQQVREHLAEPPQVFLALVPTSNLTAHPTIPGLPSGCHPTLPSCSTPA